MRDWSWRRVIVGAIALTCGLGGFSWGADGERSAPIVPGVVRLRNEAKASPTEQGEVLLGELNCLACHSADGQKRVFTKGAPDLSHAGERLTPQYIRDYLSAPHGMKPGATMPDLFHASEPQAKAGAIEFLTQYLVSLGGPIKASGEEGSSISVDRGRALFEKIGCVACHAPDNVAKTTIPSIPFPNLAEKTTVENLEDFLLDPAKIRPGSRMPSLNLTGPEARSIAIYLLRAQLENPQNKEAAPARVAGLKLQYYELKAPKNCALETLQKHKAKAEERVDHFTLDFPRNGRNSNFAAIYSGAIHIPRDGKYTFRTTSDDGSRLYIGGEMVVDNDGTRPESEKAGEIDLTEGDHPITVTYFQAAGEWVLKCEWQGPGIPRQEIPASALFTIGGKPMVPLASENFVVDPDKARMGGMMFSVIGCVSCHNMAGAAKPMRPHKTLADLNPDAPTGCLGTQIPKSVPDYQLSDDQRSALKAALKNVKDLDQPLAAEQQATHLVAAFNCYACHVRDNVGGPTADRAPFFVMSAAFDMGDEGRFPPRLTHVGAKLLPLAIEQIVCQDKLHVRPVLATRMPTFAKDRVAPLLEAIVKADAPLKDVEPKFDAVGAKDGRTLFGSRGMGCVNCHGINGIKLQGSMPAPDMGNAHDRLRYDWFHALLVDPAHINPGTRMPAFWTNGDVAFKNLGGGTMDSQIAALWSYLSLGESMALPAGLNSGGDELIPTDEPIVHRTFFAGAGNRSIAVGFPEMLHVVFDADVVRMAMAWKGRFFDAKGMWEGRGGNHLGPLGTDVINLPPGPSFAVLNKPDSAWPEVKPSKTRYQEDRNLGGRFKGYELDKLERPIFHYILDGIDIREQPIPVLKAAGPVLERKFQLSSGQPVAGLNFLAGQGKTIEPKGADEWLVDGKMTIRLSPQAVGIAQPVIRDFAGEKQLLLPVSFASGSASFTVEMSW